MRYALGAFAVTRYKSFATSANTNISKMDIGVTSDRKIEKSLDFGEDSVIFSKYRKLTGHSE